MSTQDSKLFPVYVWEVPVRIWHWVMALCMVVLAVTGYLIGTPPDSVGGEASEHFLFGYIRFAHFAAAYLFAVMFVMRVIWVFIGNRFAREIFMVPLKLFDGHWWGGLFDQTQVLPVPEARTRGRGRGTTRWRRRAMFFMYVLGTVFMICTGFALYGEGRACGAGSSAPSRRGSCRWLGNSQNVHTLHHLGMWYLIIFTMVHLYMVMREDIMSGETVISTMVNGWRVAKK